jgi:DNA-binding beta-propeller fold protein YncE
MEAFDSSGTFTLQWGARGNGPLAFNYPRGVAIDPTSGDLVVADTDNNMVKKFDPAGNLIWAVGKLGSALGQYNQPYGVIIGPDGSIYVADTFNKRVVVLTSGGTATLAFGTLGSGPGQFKSPRGVAIDPTDGTLWVTDTILGIVEHWTVSGTYLGSFGGNGTAVGQLDGPYGIAVSATSFFVANSKNSLIEEWSRNGGNPIYQLQVAGKGKAVGQVLEPQLLWLTPGNILYVAELGTSRVQKFAVDGATGTTSGTGAAGPGTDR